MRKSLFSAISSAVLRSTPWLAFAVLFLAIVCTHPRSASAQSGYTRGWPASGCAVATSSLGTSTVNVGNLANTSSTGTLTVYCPVENNGSLLVSNPTMTGWATSANSVGARLCTINGSTGASACGVWAYASTGGIFSLSLNTSAWTSGQYGYIEVYLGLKNAGGSSNDLYGYQAILTSP